MKAVKEILTENRQIIIATLMNKIKGQDIKETMIAFMDYCNGLENQLNEMVEGDFKKEIVSFIVKFKMYTYPKNKVKLADARADYMDRNNLEFDLRKKEYIKAI